MTGQMGEPWPILYADRAAVHGAHADRRPRSHRQGRRCADAGASEAAAAEDPVRHRPIRHARRQDAAVRRSGQRRRHQRTGPVESVRRRDGESLLELAAAARRLGRRLRSDQGDRRSEPRARSAHQHAGAADPPHRHSRPAPRRHGSEGRGDRLARCRSTSPPPDSSSARPGAKTTLRTAAAEFRRAPRRFPRSASTH